LKKEKRGGLDNLFCPGYKERVSFIHTTVAKRFISALMTVCNGIEEIGKTEQFKHEVALALNQEGELEREQLETSSLKLVQSTKICILEEKLNMLCEKFHLGEAISSEGVDQLKQKIINLYENSFEIDATVDKDKFEKEIKSIVDNMLGNVRRYLNDPIDIERSRKHKKLEL